MEGGREGGRVRGREGGWGSLEGPPEGMVEGCLGDYPGAWGCPGAPEWVETREASEDGGTEREEERIQVEKGRQEETHLPGEKPANCPREYRSLPSSSQ